MAYEQREGQGSLFPNTRRTADNQPNMDGKLLVGGVLYSLAAWTKKRPDGSKWLSISAQPADEYQPAGGGGDGGDSPF